MAQSTREIDWGALEFVAYTARQNSSAGLVCTPGGVLRQKTFDLAQGEQDGLKVVRAR